MMNRLMNVDSEPLAYAVLADPDGSEYIFFDNRLDAEEFAEAEGVIPLYRPVGIVVDPKSAPLNEDRHCMVNSSKESAFPGGSFPVFKVIES